MTVRPQRKATLRPVQETETYNRERIRRKVELLTLRESGYHYRAAHDSDDERPRMVDTGAYLRERRRR